MKNIGIVVCNYNKQDYVVNCVKSLFDQTVDDFDIYVVDNASDDHSVQILKEAFGNQITLLVNKENLGGSGGFNTGLREVLKKDYEYIMCVDNDVVFDSHAVEELKNFLKMHEDVGMVGSCCYFMDEPERIWSFGADIDFENFVQRDNYRNCSDSDGIPKVVYCTYVPACAMMIRTESVRKVGIMPEENFIYWDDMEWGYRFNQSGYKVAAIKDAKVWHKGGGRNGGSTFNNYYLWRNRIHFFLKVLPQEQKDYFAEVILKDMFRLVYSCNLKGDTGVVKSVMYAFNDAVNGIAGKAPEYKIFKRNTNGNRLQMALDRANSVVVKYNDDREGLGNIVRNIRKCIGNIKVAICIKGCSVDIQDMRQQYPDCEIIDEYYPEKYDKHLIMCEHIFNITSDMPQDTYIDGWCNIIYSKEDFDYARSYKQTEELFLLCKKELLLKGEN